MSVSPLGQDYASQPGTGNSAADISGSFMRLLVAQMQNQDPTNPMDNNQLTSQLAMLNTASGVENLNKSVYAVGMMLDSMQQMNAVSWVGREVLVAGDAQVNWDGEAAAGTPLNVNLSGEASKVTVTLTDASGNAYTAELPGAKPGVNKFTLADLKNFQPSQPQSGSDYRLSWSAQNDAGEAPVVTGLVAEKVEGVSFTEQGAALHLARGGSVTLKDIFVIQ